MKIRFFINYVLDESILTTIKINHEEQVYSPSAADSSLPPVFATYLHLGAIAAFALLGLDLQVRFFTDPNVAWKSISADRTEFHGVICVRTSAIPRHPKAQCFGLGLWSRRRNFRPDPASRRFFRCHFNGCLHHRVAGHRVDRFHIKSFLSWRFLKIGFWWSRFHPLQLHFWL